MARAGFGRGHEDSSESPSASREVLPERMNQARRWAYHDGFHEEAHGIGPTPIMCRRPAASVKATRRIPAFPHNGQHVVRNALRLKLHGAPAALEDRAGCFDSSFSAIVAQDSIVSDTHQSRRQDMQAEAPDELQGGEG